MKRVEGALKNKLCESDIFCKEDAYGKESTIITEQQKRAGEEQGAFL